MSEADMASFVSDNNSLALRTSPTIRMILPTGQEKQRSLRRVPCRAAVLIRDRGDALHVGEPQIDPDRCVSSPSQEIRTYPLRSELNNKRMPPL